MKCPNCENHLQDWDFSVSKNSNQGGITVWLECICGYRSGRNLDESDFEEEYK